MIVRGMVTQTLDINCFDPLLFKQLSSTVLFRQLQDLCYLGNKYSRNHFYIHVLPYLEQINELAIHESSIPAYSLDINLPLVHTLQKLILEGSSFS
jgi:hypothetical protein